MPMQSLSPVSVPWQISPSAPYLKLYFSDTGKPVAATFIGFFKCEVGSESKDAVKIYDPGEFVSAGNAKGAQHRLVQVVFREGVYAKLLPAFGDHEVVKEELYDWSLVPTGVKGNETTVESITRVQNLWLSTGYCPDPCMYEVQNSDLLASLNLNTTEWHHYLFLGHDEYVEAIARGWQWNPGQIVI